MKPDKTPALALALLALASLLVAGQARAAAPALNPPSGAALDEARSLVERMKSAERGPYSRLRWYCKDGTVHPPTPYACAERGGGRQHGEFSPERERLAELGFSVGTVFAALEWDRFFDAANRNRRLRELPLERYMIEIDDGWVLRRARYYRGRVQVEDEEAAGRALLLRLLSDGNWVASNYLVARELARSVPHHGGADRTRIVRRLSQELAEKSPSFERLRIKIHTTPGPEDIDATRGWIETAKSGGAASAALKIADALARELETLYGESGLDLLVENELLASRGVAAELRPLLSTKPDGDSEKLLSSRAAALALVRDQVAGSSDGAASLALLDLSLALEREVGRLAFLRLREAKTRRDLLRLARSLTAAGYGAGLLSARERDALADPLIALAGDTAPDQSVPTSDYLRAVRNLRRSGVWAAATARFSFAEPLAFYSALDPRAQRFVDDLLRGSPLLPLAEVTVRLTSDADRIAGVAHRVFGTTVAGTLGLNPGVAIGPLRLAGGDGSPQRGAFARSDIAVLPETVSELQPVAGILTLAEGNLLSHVQLLARNLGIPNASLTPAAGGAISAKAGTEVLLAVGSDGSVILEELGRIPHRARELTRAGRAEQTTIKLDAPQPDLGRRQPLTLEELSASLAGRTVGPKAANLGELARVFPGRVEQAIALPFGVFFEHTSQGERSPRSRLLAAFAAHRAGQLDDAGLAAEVEAVRLEVEQLSVTPELGRRLRALMTERFGSEGDYGVFVRSDTNVEDLPGFTGAGLNLTVANVVGADKVTAAIPRVWASAYSARSMAWRSTILARPEDVFTSVLLMKAVPATKSGVLVTADLATRGAGLTVACAWGVGGAVDGEAAETLVLRPDGSTLLIGEAKAPYQRRLRREGGVEWIPAPAGSVLELAEQQALRTLAAEVDAKLSPERDADGQPLPWDIEFGFVDGRLELFQIRPLIERGEALADRVVDSLTTARPQVPATVDLTATPGPTDEPFPGRS